MKKYHRTDGKGRETMWSISLQALRTCTGKHSQRNGILVFKTFEKWSEEKKREREYKKNKTENLVLYNSIDVANMEKEDWFQVVYTMFGALYPTQAHSKLESRIHVNTVVIFCPLIYVR